MRRRTPPGIRILALTFLPVLTAVVVNWNGRHHLERSMPALLAQQPPPDEVIVVDNHSDDDSREYLAERFPRVSVIDTGGNLGPARARNAGVDAARHERVLLLDNDVVLTPGALQRLVATLEDHPDAALVQARSVCADRQEVVHYDAADVHFLGLLLLRNWYVPLAAARDPRGPTGGFVALCVLIDKAAYRRAGGFLGELFLGFEDTELAVRLRRLGYTLWCEPRAVVLHFEGTAGLSRRGPGARYPARRVYLHSRNRGLVLLSCLRWRTLLLTLPSQLLYGALYFAFALGQGHVLAWWRGKLDQVALLPAAFARRRSLRSALRAAGVRGVPDRELLLAGRLTLNPGLTERGFWGSVLSLCEWLWGANWKLLRWACG
jgi:hypothetical protein